MIDPSENWNAPSPKKKMKISDKGPTTSRMTSAEAKFAKPKRKARKSKLQVTYQHESENTPLYHTLMSDGSANINSVVNDWIQSYKNDNKKGFLDLIQLIINFSGRTASVTQEFVDLKNCDLINNMSSDNETMGNGYPLIRNGLKWKKLTKNYKNFIKTLVEYCSETIIYDKFLFGKLFSTLQILSTSQARSVRHTSIFTVTKMVTAIVDIFVSSMDVLHLLDDSETTVLQNNIERLKGLLNFFNSKIFFTAYRDIFCEIRIIVISEFFVWINKCPDFFITKDSLYYISHLLYDKTQMVKHKCIDILKVVFSLEPNEISNEFLRKNIRHLHFMVMIENNNISIKLLGLFKIIMNHHTVSSKVSNSLFMLVFTKRLYRARAAGEFLHAFIMKMLKECDESHKNTIVKRYIFFVIDFCIEYCEDLNNVKYVVDSLMKCSDFLFNWECYIELLEDLSDKKENKDHKKESVLINIMMCSVKQAISGISPRTELINIVAGKKDNEKTSIKEQQKVTTLFLPIMLSLLNCFNTNPLELSRLLAISRYFHIDENVFANYETELNEILERIKNIFTTSDNSSLLHSCIITLKYLSATDSSFRNHCKAALSSIINNSIKHYVTNVQYWNKYESNENLMDLENYAVSLIKSSMILKVICKHHSIDDPKITCFIVTSLSKYLKQSSFPPQALKHSMTCVYLILMWNLNKIEKGIQMNKNVEDEIEILKTQLQAIKILYLQIIVNCPSEELQREAFIQICDLFCIFSEKLQLKFKKIPAIQILIIKPDKNVCSLLSLYVQNAVFTEHSGDKSVNKTVQNFVLMAYCKLLIYNIVPTILATNIIEHYYTFSSKYGDTITFFMRQIQLCNSLNLYLLMIKCLQNLFFTNKRFNDNIEIYRSSHLKLKKLAEKFALFLNINKPMDSKQNGIVNLHKRGITISFETDNESLDATAAEPIIPPNLAFLEILTELTNILTTKDRKNVLEFLNKKIKNVENVEGDDWQPILNYRRAITQGMEQTKGVAMDIDIAD